MSKIYDALKQAQREKIESWSSGPQPSAKSIAAPGRETGCGRAFSSVDTALEKAMNRLYQGIESRLPDCPRKVVQFMGSRKGEGVSTIVHDFGLIMAANLGKPVLILDADRLEPVQHLLFGLAPESGWDGLLSGNSPFGDGAGGGESSCGGIDKVLHQVDGTDLYVCPASPKGTIARHVFDPVKMDSLLKQLRTRFDLVIVDSPPAESSPDGLAMARSADGVVLVLGAETTRWPVAMSTKEAIEKSGGNILGSVFDKHRYHIPEFIYKRL